ncbi:hypothetical protein NW765_011102 [Fusarium oxysporum]|nr:hypothetical protein NW765_011102 [Fusarium oxysporum]KAJ4279171.1 hypothetical protein NW764_006530 [Fusarium oxysporum]
MGSLIPNPGRCFTSDNIAGASPEIVQAVVAAATGHVPPYGNDGITGAARQRLQEIFEGELDVFPVSSGTAANCIGLASLVKPWGSILCHPDSHINNDECGAPEAFTGGSKLVTVPGSNSKIDPKSLRAAVCRKVGDVHSVQPSVLSISQPTETGSVYTIAELKELCTIAKDAGLRVHMDGARFANALVHLEASPAEMTWEAGVDVLSFGLTKNGAMTVDIIISFDPTLASELAFRQKRAGQLASKMRFHTAQIEAYLAEGLWLRNARYANGLALRLAAGLRSVSGPEVLQDPEANILFCRLAPAVIKELLCQGYQFYHDRWEPGSVRLVASFSHSPSSVDELVAAVGSCYSKLLYKGNQVAVVQVQDDALPPADMQMIAREFNFSETVFLRRNTDGAVAINIFTPVNEMDFAGHPVIGTGHVLFRQLLPSLAVHSSEATLWTNAGPVVVRYDPSRETVAADVPHNVHIHSRHTSTQSILDTQPSLKTQGLSTEQSYPCVSIVKGVTYTLVDFTNQPSLFTAISAGPSQLTELDEGWAPSFTGVMYYRVLSDPYDESGKKVQHLRIRMIAIGLEDPACGSGSCALGAYLALQQGDSGGMYRFYLDQGQEIGRDSSIIVDIVLDETGDKVTNISLSGSATPVTEGTILLPE